MFRNSCVLRHLRVQFEEVRDDFGFGRVGLPAVAFAKAGLEAVGGENGQHSPSAQ